MGLQIHEVVPALLFPLIVIIECLSDFVICKPITNSSFKILCNVLGVFHLIISHMSNFLRNNTYPLLHFAISSNRSFHRGRPIKSLEFSAWYFSPIIFCQKESTIFYMTQSWQITHFSNIISADDVASYQITVI